MPQNDLGKYHHIFRGQNNLITESCIKNTNQFSNLALDLLFIPSSKFCKVGLGFDFFNMLGPQTTQSQKPLNAIRPHHGLDIITPDSQIVVEQITVNRMALLIFDLSGRKQIAMMS